MRKKQDYYYFVLWLAETVYLYGRCMPFSSRFQLSWKLTRIQRLHRTICESRYRCLNAAHIDPNWCCTLGRILHIPVLFRLESIPQDCDQIDLIHLETSSTLHPHWSVPEVPHIWPLQVGGIQPVLWLAAQPGCTSEGLWDLPAVFERGWMFVWWSKLQGLAPVSAGSTKKYEWLLLKWKMKLSNTYLFVISTVPPTYILNFIFWESNYIS